jgi:hypothetical protein
MLPLLPYRDILALCDIVSVFFTVLPFPYCDIFHTVSFSPRAALETHTVLAYPWASEVLLVGYQGWVRSGGKRLTSAHCLNEISPGRKSHTGD